LDFIPKRTIFHSQILGPDFEEKIAMAQVPLILARHFSASAASSQLVKAPIQLFGIEGRYATALYSAASKEKQLDAVEKDLISINGLLKKKGKFNDFLLNPSLNRTEKKLLLEKTLNEAKASKLTANLVGLLAENGRLNKLGGIANSYSQIMAAHRGEINCEVTTAKPLDAALQQELDAALKAFVKSGQTIKVASKVDPSIMGGMIVSIGDKYVDMSTASKVKRFTELIKAAV
jgi:F-type H+-transporting ATPase subunit O